MRRPRTFAPLLAALLALPLVDAGVAAAQAPAAGAPPEPPAAAPASPDAAAASSRPALDPAVQEQLREAGAAAARGDLAGAIARLAPLAAAGTLPPAGISMLGTLRLETGDAAGALEVLAPLAARAADPAVLYHAGRAALALGRTEEGAGYLARSVELEAGTPAARELGLLRGRQGDLVSALELLSGWVAARPDDAEARLAAAYSAIRLRRAPLAESLLAGLPEEDPKARLLRGELLLLRGQPQEAAAALRPLVAGADAAAGDARRLLAEAELSMGRSGEAVELLLGRVAGKPESALLLARALQQQGELEAARAALEPFTTTPPGPQVPGLLREYGRLLLSLQRFPEAVAVLQRATEIDPRDDQAWYALGQAAGASGQSDLAELGTLRFKALQEEQEPPASREQRAEEELTDPTGVHAREALVLLQRGRLKEALDLARRESRLAPRDPRPFLVESRVLLLLNRGEEALAAAERACALAPESADTLYQRGAARIALGQQEAAEADLRAALALSAEHTAAMTDLAVLLMVQGKPEEARRLLERVVALRPDDPLAAANLERARRLPGGG